jgi:hypothetical protein
VQWLPARSVRAALRLRSTTGSDAARVFASTHRTAGSGFVEEVRYASRLDRPDVIAVRAGLLVRLLLIVPVGEIAEIFPGDERIVLHRSPRPTATKRLRTDLRGHVLPGRRRSAASGEVAGVRAGATRIEARKEVEAVIERLTRRIGLRFRRGGQREMTPDVEASAEPSAEEPSAEEPSTEAPSAEERPEEEPAGRRSASRGGCRGGACGEAGGGRATGGRADLRGANDRLTFTPEVAVGLWCPARIRRRSPIPRCKLPGRPPRTQNVIGNPR